ncbi:MAG: trypsin-like peptidase domain-containing protein [Planctomycetaceae bacterium]|nr:trypsin-like peptidase domain-containing protein [Planctomycetaceae bacterium]
MFLPAENLRQLMRTPFQLGSLLASFGFVLLASALSAQTVDIPQAVLEAQERRIETIAKVAPTVVAIFAPGGQGGGSGVLISPDGFCVTNFHVVEGMQGFMKCGLNDGNIYDAVICGIDPTGDLAVIQLLGRTDFPTASIGNSDDVQIGDWTFAMGNPFLLAEDLQPTVTYGMVSGTHRYQYPAGTFLEYTDCIQVDTSINPGNSGGPLFNEQGELIGINGRISVEKRGRVNVGAGYSISVNQVMYFLDHLKSGRVVDHATLGATVTSVSDGSIIVGNILERSSAYQLGLRSGDELIAFAGRPVRSVNQFKNILGIYPKGWTLPLSYRREGKRYDINVRLMSLHRDAELATGDPKEEAPHPPVPEELLEMLRPKKDVPEEYKHMFVERRNFVNYYFNELAQKRMLTQIQPWGDFSGRTGLWHLQFATVGGKQLDVKLTPEVAAAKYGEEIAVQQLTNEFVDVPANSGGMLAALVQMRMLLQNPEGYFTDFYYLGSEPLDGTGPNVDVLLTSKGLVECRWYFDKEAGGFVGFDTWLSEDVPPCEIRLNGSMSTGGLSLPKTWTVRRQGETFAEFTLQSAELSAQTETGQ